MNKVKIQALHYIQILLKLFLIHKNIEQSIVQIYVYAHKLFSFKPGIISDKHIIKHYSVIQEIKTVNKVNIRTLKYSLI